MTGRPHGLHTRRRDRGGVSRMIGCWPEGIRFEDAAVPPERFFKGPDREVPGVWPESSLSTTGRIVRRR